MLFLSQESNPLLQSETVEVALSFFGLRPVLLLLNLGLNVIAREIFELLLNHRWILLSRFANVGESQDVEVTSWGKGWAMSSE